MGPFASHQRAAMRSKRATSSGSTLDEALVGIPVSRPAAPSPCVAPARSVIYTRLFAPAKGRPAGRSASASCVLKAPPMPRLVMKFGGTSVATVERIRNVARHVEREVRAGYDVAVVVSAMAGKTKKLGPTGEGAGPPSRPRGDDLAGPPGGP